MKLNTSSHNTDNITHGGGRAKRLTPLDQLERMVMTCLLWENSFYEKGSFQAAEIEGVCKVLKWQDIVNVAVKTHESGRLRHMPLFLIVQALKQGALCKNEIKQVCSRPDQMGELLTLYWKDGRKPICAQLKKGLALAFKQFDEYQLAKYNRDANIKLRDILFLVHPKPDNEQQQTLWNKLVKDELATPNTWEVRLSAGQNKKEVFEDLLKNKKLGALAFIRNLRNMHEAGIEKEFVKEHINGSFRKYVLPFQFISAAKELPEWEDLIDYAMCFSSRSGENIKGNTAVFVDVSASMCGLLSLKSKLTYLDAACGLAILLRERVVDQCDFFTFSNTLKVVPSRHGFALRDALVHSQTHASTDLKEALQLFKQTIYKPSKYDRFIIITDEQTNLSHMPDFVLKYGYILNVAHYSKGIDTNGAWTTISGFSENVVDYIYEVEKESES